MGLDELPEVRLEEAGVMFKYLVLKLASNGGERVLVRGVNWKPYEPDAVQRIVNWTWDELEAEGFQEGRDELALEGGGTLSVNPYYEKITLFGEIPGVGSEGDRQATCRMVQAAFPDHTVQWFPAEEEKPKKAVKKPPAKAAKEGEEQEEEEAKDSED